MFARTMVPGGGVSSPVVGAQPPPAVAASGQPLQQRSTLSHRATGLVGLGAGCWRRGAPDWLHRSPSRCIRGDGHGSAPPTHLGADGEPACEWPPRRPRNAHGGSSHTHRRRHTLDWSAPCGSPCRSVPPSGSASGYWTATEKTALPSATTARPGAPSRARLGARIPCGWSRRPLRPDGSAPRHRPRPRRGPPAVPGAAPRGRPCCGSHRRGARG